MKSRITALSLALAFASLFFFAAPPASAGDHRIRGGRVMAYTDDSGTRHAASFWVLDDLKCSMSEGRIALTFVGYKDVAAYNADRLPLTGAKRQYFLGGARYFAALQLVSQQPAGTTIAARILELAWMVALTERDHIVDRRYPDVKSSFFADSTAAPQ